MGFRISFGDCEVSFFHTAYLMRRLESLVYNCLTQMVFFALNNGRTTAFFIVTGSRLFATTD